MTTPPSIIRQSDLTRAIRAADKSAIPRAVEITRDGTIRIVPALANRCLHSCRENRAISVDIRARENAPPAEASGASGPRRKQTKPGWDTDLG